MEISNLEVPRRDNSVGYQNVNSTYGTIGE
jgi:hypothetical protein